MTADAASGDRAALLAWVAGTPLTGDSEQRLIGETLARVHRVPRDQTVPGTQGFHWVDPAAAHLGLRPWIRPAVTAAVDALAALQDGKPAWPQGLLHADRAPEAFRYDTAPAPEAFRYDTATGQCCIIDWNSAHWRVPGGAYDDTALDTGGGLRPELTGLNRGLGRRAIAVGLAYGRSQFRPAAFRVTVADFNARARRVVESLGFTCTSSFDAATDGRRFNIFFLSNPDPGAQACARGQASRSAALAPAPW